MECDIVILAGQSNACGRGQFLGVSRNSRGRWVEMLVSDAYRNSLKHENTYMLDARDQIVRAKDRIVHLERPERGSFPSNRNMIGSVSTFAKQHAQASGRNVLIVGCGFGGTGIMSVTNRNYWWGMQDTVERRNGRNVTIRSLYHMSRARIQAAWNQVDTTKSRVIALIWQGSESDLSIAATSPINFQTRMSEMLGGLRNMCTTMNNSNPTILISGLVADTYRNPQTGVPRSLDNRYRMQGILRELASSMQNAYFVTSAAASDITSIDAGFRQDFASYLAGDVWYHSDGSSYRSYSGPTHFNATSHVTMGRRWYYVFYRKVSVEDTDASLQFTREADETNMDEETPRQPLYFRVTAAVMVLVLIAALMLSIYLQGRVVVQTIKGNKNATQMLAADVGSTLFGAVLRRR
jgi:hypothetical protein